MLVREVSRRRLTLLTVLLALLLPRWGLAPAAAAEDVMPPSVPDRVSALAGPKSVDVRWLEPLDDGGGLVLEYQLRVRVGDQVVASQLVPAWLVVAHVGGLTDGQGHTAEVRARNVSGWGPYSVGTAFVPGDEWIVSVGDSFIAGEAGRWAGNTNLPTPGVHDALGPQAYWDAPTGESIEGCHRSKSAEVHIGGVRSLNLACSGAITSSEFDGDEWKPGVDFADDGVGHKGQALMLREFAQQGHRIGAVVVSIGGNDMKFSTIVKTCAAHYVAALAGAYVPCALDPLVLQEIDDDSLDVLAKRIEGAYRNVSQAMTDAGYTARDYTIIVQNYAMPLPPAALVRYPDAPDPVRQVVGGCPVLNPDLDFLNYVVAPALDGAIRTAIEQSALPNIRLLDLSDAVRGRRLCEVGVGLVEDMVLPTWQAPLAVDLTEWVNAVRTLTTAGTPYMLVEGAHPNYWGQLAQRGCLREAFNGGRPRGGECVRVWDGLLPTGEPKLALQGTTELVDVTAAGEPGGDPGTENSAEVAISRDGRFVAFCTKQTLVPEDTNTWHDVYLRDRILGTTRLVGLAESGALPDAPSCEYHGPSLSGDGRFLAFESRGSNIVAGDANGGSDVFVRDLRTGAVTRDSASGGDLGWTWDPEISPDGRWIVMQSDAKIDPDREQAGIFIRDRVSGVGELVSIGEDGRQDQTALDPAVSGDGRYVVFTSADADLVAGDTNGAADVFVRDRQTGTTERLSVVEDGNDINSGAVDPDISADGRYVVFNAHVWLPDGINRDWRVFLHDRREGSTIRLEGEATLEPQISRDGRSVTYSVQPGGGIYVGRKVLLYDVPTGATRSVTIPIYDRANEPPGVTWAFNSAPADDGAAVAFLNSSNNLVADDRAGWDYFVWAQDCAGDCDGLGSGDVTAPNLQSMVEGPAGAAGWYTGPVSVTIQASDSQSGVATLTYTVGDQPPVTQATGSATVRLDAPGTTTITASATDAAGNTATRTTYVRIDGRAPEVTCPAAPTSWSASDVTLTCTASDPTSGLQDPASASPTLSTSVPAGTETSAAVTTAVEVCDLAGNCATAGPVTGLRVDKQPPTILIRVPAEGGTYPEGAPITVDYECGDAGSGVASCQADTPPITAGPQSVSVRAADRVGNTTTATRSYIVESRPPTAEPPPPAPEPPPSTGEAPPPAEPAAVVIVKAVQRGNKLFVDVDPNKGKGYWRFKIQTKKPDGSWVTSKKTNRTQGAKETKTLNLKKGTYRVMVLPKYQLHGATSGEVTLRR